MTAKDETFSEIFFETFILSDVDKDGRVFGYTVGIREVLGSDACYAWVQRALQTKDGFRNFGVPQRSKRFPSKEAAKKWGFGTAKIRIAARQPK